MTQEEGSKMIALKTAEIYKLIAECESIADDCEVNFHFEVAYGMGGNYSGSECEWNSSSANC